MRVGQFVIALSASIGAGIMALFLWPVVSGAIAGILDSIGVVVPASAFLSVTPGVAAFFGLLGFAAVMSS